MKIKKLLFVTKFEQLWFDALETLLELKKAALNHVVFLNVIEREKVALHRGTGYEKSEEIKLREKANIRFIDWAENLFEQGLEVGSYIVVGELVPQVISAVKKEAVDLIVIGRPHKGPLEQIYSGSDVIEIIRRAERPVLVYKYLPGDDKNQRRLFERPLLATDGSPASGRALTYLCDMAGAVKEVNVVRVVKESSLKGDSTHAVQKTRKDVRKALDEICDTLETCGIKARPHIYVGQTREEIERGVRECQATMVVCGTSGKTTWKERWIGSTPRDLAEKSDFPTLLIPPEGPDG